MCLELEKLNKLYIDSEKTQKSNFEYKSETVNTIENFSIDKENYDMNLRYIRVNNEYKIFFFIGNSNKLIFHGIYIDRDTDLDDEYRVIKNDLVNLSVSEFVKKYYEKLVKNF